MTDSFTSRCPQITIVWMESVVMEISCLQIFQSFQRYVLRFVLSLLTYNLKIHIHSIDHHEGKRNDGIIAEEFNKGTTVNTYIGMSTEAPPSTPGSRSDDKDASVSDASSVVGDIGKEVLTTTDFAPTISLSSKPTSAATMTSLSKKSTIFPTTSSVVVFTAQSDDAGDDVALPEIRPTTKSPTEELETTRPGTTPSTVVTSTTSNTTETSSIPAGAHVDEVDGVGKPGVLPPTTIPPTTEKIILTIDLNDSDPSTTKFPPTVVTFTTSTTTETFSVPAGAQVDEVNVDLPEVLPFTTIPPTTINLKLLETTRPGTTPSTIVTSTTSTTTETSSLPAGAQVDEVDGIDKLGVIPPTTIPPTAVTSTPSTTTETFSVQVSAQADEVHDVDIPEVLPLTTIPPATEAIIFTINLNDVNLSTTNSPPTTVSSTPTETFSVNPSTTNSSTTVKVTSTSANSVTSTPLLLSEVKGGSQAAEVTTTLPVIASVTEAVNHVGEAGTTTYSGPSDITSTPFPDTPGSPITTEPVVFIKQSSNQLESVTTAALNDENVTTDESITTSTSATEENLTNLATTEENLETFTAIIDEKTRSTRSSVTIENNIYTSTYVSEVTTVSHAVSTFLTTTDVITTEAIDLMQKSTSKSSMGNDLFTIATEAYVIDPITTEEGSVVTPYSQAVETSSIVPATTRAAGGNVGKSPVDGVAVTKSENLVTKPDEQIATTNFNELASTTEAINRDSAEDELSGITFNAEDLIGSSTKANKLIVTTTESGEGNVATTKANELELSSAVSEVSETTSSADELVSTTTEAEELVFTTTEAVEFVSTTTEADELVSTTEADKLVSTTTEVDEFVETTTVVDELIETTTGVDELLETTTEADELIVTTTEADELIATTTEADELADTTTEADELIATTTEADELADTTTEAYELADTTTEAYELIVATTEVDELIFTSVADELISTTTLADKLISTTTLAGEIITTTEVDKLIATTTEADELLASTTEADYLIATTTEVDKIITTFLADEEIAHTTEADDLVITTTVADELIATSTLADEEIATTTEADDLISTTTEVDKIIATTEESDELNAITTEADELIGTTTEADDLVSTTTEPDYLIATNTEADKIIAITELDEPFVITTEATTADELVFTTIKTDGVTSSGIDDSSFTLRGEFVVINTFFQTPLVASNSSISFFRRLLERDLGIMFEQATPSVPRGNVHVEKVVVVETSSGSAYTRLKREVKEQKHTEASSTVLRVWFTVRYDDISYTAHQSSLRDTSSQILHTLPGIITHTITIESENCKSNGIIQC